jgi:hypothetical protein
MVPGGTPLNDHRISISREELYEKVWTTPMQKLAPRFGLSDVGLAKLCRRHQIPVPGRGYWARLQVGQKPKRAVLPNAVVNRIEIVPQEKRQAEAMPVMPDRPIPVIEVSEDRPMVHRQVVRIDKSVLRGKKDDRGVLLAREANELREFAITLKESVPSPTVPIEQKLGILRIVDWIERHANSVDPLTDIGRIIQRFDKFGQ